MSWWQHISLIAIQSIHAPHHLLYMFHRVLPRKKKKHDTMTTWRVNQPPQKKSNKMSSKYFGVVVSASFLHCTRPMEPSWVFQNGHCFKLIAPKPSNQGPSVIGVEPHPRWPISCHGVGTRISMNKYHGVCWFYSKRRFQWIEAYMNLRVSWVSTAFGVKTKGFHTVCW